MSDLLDEDRLKLARVLGMKPREIIAAAEVPNANPPAAVVETHDGQRVLVISDRAGGQPVVAPWEGPMPGEPAAEVVGEHGPEVITGPGTVVPNLTPGDGDDGPGGGDEEVPTGTAEVVLTWVGDSADRARLALVVEQDSAKPRSTLIADLKKLAGQA